LEKGEHADSRDIKKHRNDILYIRKLRHSVVSRQERMRSILWNWPLDQFFFKDRIRNGFGIVQAA
jgi:hypothetical protein